MTGSPTATGNPGDLAVDLTGIEKTFGSVRANRGASLQVRKGEIHALVGENGAGKSTLMKILGGLQKPDAGKMIVNGRDVTGWNTSDAIAAGIGVVHQHFMLVPTLTVAENMVLGMEPTSGGKIDYAKAVADVEKLSKETGLTVNANAKVAELSVGEAQRVEILKALFRGAKILVLDEPTAVLSPPEVKELWTVLRRLRDSGDTIIIITHRLDEVIEISEAITVMRAGQTVDRLKTSDSTPQSIARSMVGRDVVLTERDEASALGARLEGELNTEAQFHPSDDMTSAIRAEDIVVMGSRNLRAVDGVSFSIRPGEILGIAGVEGNGQTELIEALAGLRPIVSGLMRIHGHEVTTESIQSRRDSGLSHIPEDRHHRGLILDYSISDNLLLGLQNDFSKRGILNQDKIAENAETRIKEFDVRPHAPDLPARGLSGGNQQKVVIAREMGRPFDILLASQPTRGVDVGAIEFIHSRLREARAAGKAILLVSAELKEVLALSDRVAVMYRGKLTKVIPASEANEEILGEYMTGTKTENAA